MTITKSGSQSRYEVVIVSGRQLQRALFAVVLLGLGRGTATAEDRTDHEAELFFESRVRPILVQRCYSCHSLQSGKQEGELAVDSKTGLLEGGSRGSPVVPHDPARSLLIQAIRYEQDDLAMPPSGKLPASEIETLASWIRRGGVVPERGKASGDDDPRGFWSFQVPRTYALPKVSNGQWPSGRIDYFVLREMEQRDLRPSREADRRALIRRATFDLLGLPPSEAHVEAFNDDSAVDAYKRLIDRLLASPHYGERWGRHWLDLTRYTDATAVWLKSTGNAWLYRDWVVTALNEDLPYDDFAQRQLAADLMPECDPRDIAALGFVGLSPTYWKEPRLAPDVIKVVVAEEWEERIDAFSRTFLGLTVACARCHDHKFDPVTMQDYYALAGVFANSKLVDRPLLPAAEAVPVMAAREKVHALEEEILGVKKTDPDRAEKLQFEVDEIKRTTPRFDAPMAHAVEEASIHVLPDGPDATRVEYHPGEMLDLPIFLRGNPNTPGELAPRRFLSVLSDSDSALFNQGSGRLELARSLFDEGLPLAARVIVNRVWRHHFGSGLVATPSNFGQQGERPTHPELLDDLAAGFVSEGWSLKWLHREILLSATYRQSSAFDARAHRIDPENRWLWRMNRRRLDVEAWRDSCLAASGELNLSIGGPAVELNDDENRRRTLYARIARRELDVMLRQYDFPEPESHSPFRSLTTTPLQQLFVLNSPFFQQRARACVAALSSDRLEERLHVLYGRLFQREPSAEELEAARSFLDGSFDDQGPWAQYIHVLLGSNEFMFVD